MFQLVGTEGLPSLPALFLCVNVMVGLVSGPLIRCFQEGDVARPADNLGRFAINFYVLGLSGIAFYGQPEDHFSAGLHQR